MTRQPPTANRQPPPGYYDQPLLKPPVWTWEVPTYFFVGGAAGAAAVLAAAAQLSGEDESLVRDARWIAAIGANLSTPLLIADLGRPERFLNMLRVFNPKSPMSVGAWTVAAFGTTSTAAVLSPLGKDFFAALSALTGLAMSTYTGVLLGVSAIPVWKEHARLLPVHFGASALGAACSLLELRGHKQRALSTLALGAAIFETAAPGENQALMKTAAALSGPVPFILRLIGKRKAAAATTVLGSLLTRFAWVEAGKSGLRQP
jgi:formate-dependent nitrite reductase membrane component NrfD